MIDSLAKIAEGGFNYILSLPIDVRRSNYALVKRATLGELSDVLSSLDQGDYYFAVTLPNAMKVGISIKVPEHGNLDASAVLARLGELSGLKELIDSVISDEAIARAKEWAEIFLDDAGEMFRSGLPEIAARIDVVFEGFAVSDPRPSLPSTIDLAWFAQSNGDWTPMPFEKMSIQEQPTGYTIKLSEPGTLRIGMAGQVPKFVMVPPDFALSIALPQEQEDPVKLSLSTGDRLVDDLMERLRESRLTEVTSTVSALQLSYGIELANSNVSAAIILAHLMIVVGRFEDAKAIVDAIRTPSHAGSDLGILKAKLCLALQEGDEKASAQIVEALSLGMPDFSFALDYLIDMRRLLADKFLTNTTWAAKAQALSTLAAAQEAAVFSDFTEPLNNWTGWHPAEPTDDETAAPRSELLTPYEANEANPAPNVMYRDEAN